MKRLKIISGFLIVVLIASQTLFGSFNMPDDYLMSRSEEERMNEEDRKREEKEEQERLEKLRSWSSSSEEEVTGSFAADIREEVQKEVQRNRNLLEEERKLRGQEELKKKKRLEMRKRKKQERIRQEFLKKQKMIQSKEKKERPAKQERVTGIFDGYVDSMKNFIKNAGLKDLSKGFAQELRDKDKKLGSLIPEDKIKSAISFINGLVTQRRQYLFGQQQSQRREQGELQKIRDDFARSLKQDKQKQERLRKEEQFRQQEEQKKRLDWNRQQQFRQEQEKQKRLAWNRQQQFRQDKIKMELKLEEEKLEKIRKQQAWLKNQEQQFIKFADGFIVGVKGVTKKRIRELDQDFQQALIEAAERFGIPLPNNIVDEKINTIRRLVFQKRQYLLKQQLNQQRSQQSKQFIPAKPQQMKSDTGTADTTKYNAFGLKGGMIVRLTENGGSEPVKNQDIVKDLLKNSNAALFCYCGNTGIFEDFAIRLLKDINSQKNKNPRSNILPIVIRLPGNRTKNNETNALHFSEYNSFIEIFTGKTGVDAVIGYIRINTNSYAPMPDENKLEMEYLVKHSKTQTALYVHSTGYLHFDDYIRQFGEKKIVDDLKWKNKFMTGACIGTLRERKNDFLIFNYPSNKGDKLELDDLNDRSFRAMANTLLYAYDGRTRKFRFKKKE